MVLDAYIQSPPHVDLTVGGISFSAVPAGSIFVAKIFQAFFFPEFKKTTAKAVGMQVVQKSSCCLYFLMI